MLSEFKQICFLDDLKGALRELVLKLRFCFLRRFRYMEIGKDFWKRKYRVKLVRKKNRIFIEGE